MRAIRDKLGNFFTYKTAHHVAVLVSRTTFGFVYLDNRYAPLKFEGETPDEAKANARAKRNKIQKRAEGSLRNAVKHEEFVDGFLAAEDPAPDPIVQIKDREVPVPVYRELETVFVDPATAMRLAERFPPEERDSSKPISYYLEKLDGEEPASNDSFVGCLWRALRSKRFWPRKKQEAMPMTASFRSPSPDLDDKVTVRLVMEVECKQRHAATIEQELSSCAPYLQDNGMITGLGDAMDAEIELDWDTAILPTNHE